MTQSVVHRLTHTDIDLLLLRMQLTPGQRLQAMLDAHALLVGVIRGRLRSRYPDLPDREINLKVVEEIERAQRFPSRPQPLP
jgi:hypothetical protein